MALGARVGKPQVKQGGVIAQVTADVVEQVVPQEPRQPAACFLARLARTRTGGEGRGALCEGISKPRPS